MSVSNSNQCLHCGNIVINPLIWQDKPDRSDDAEKASASKPKPVNSQTTPFIASVLLLAAVIPFPADSTRPEIWIIPKICKFMFQLFGAGLARHRGWAHYEWPTLLVKCKGTVCTPRACTHSEHRYRDHHSVVRGGCRPGLFSHILFWN